VGKTINVENNDQSESKSCPDLNFKKQLKRKKLFFVIDIISVVYLIIFYVSLCTIDFINVAIESGYIKQSTFGMFLFSIPTIGGFSLIWLICRHYKSFPERFPKIHKFFVKYHLFSSLILAGILFSGYLATRIIYEIYFK